MITTKSGVSVAASAALFALAASTPAAPALASHHAAQVHCYGVNTCKGTSDCKTAHNSCRGMNDCKGHGFKAMSKKQCAATGGSLTEI